MLNVLRQQGVPASAETTYYEQLHNLRYVQKEPFYIRLLHGLSEGDLRRISELHVARRQSLGNLYPENSLAGIANPIILAEYQRFTEQLREHARYGIERIVGNSRIRGIGYATRNAEGTEIQPDPESGLLKTFFETRRNANANYLNAAEGQAAKAKLSSEKWRSLAFTDLTSDEQEQVLARIRLANYEGLGSDNKEVSAEIARIRKKIRKDDPASNLAALQEYASLLRVPQESAAKSFETYPVVLDNMHYRPAVPDNGPRLVVKATRIDEAGKSSEFFADATALKLKRDSDGIPLNELAGVEIDTNGFSPNDKFTTDPDSLRILFPNL